MRRLAVLVVLAACPPKSAQAPQPAGAGCPSAAGVFVASYVTQDPAKGRSGWVIPLHSMPVEPGAAVADYAPLDDAAAMASGVPPGPQGTPWLITAAGAPCRAKLGGHYAAKIDGPPTSLSYGLELDGCPPPGDPQEGGGIVLVSDQSPGGCQLEVPKPIAARLGEMTEQQQWQRPTKATPIPPALAAAIPAHDCQAPACEPLWAFGEVDVAGKPVAWSGAVNWLAVGDPSQPCHWKAERLSGFFVPGSDGKPIKVETDKPLVLSAVLVDGGGAKALLAEGPGQYATYDLAPGTATLARHVAWMQVPVDAWDMVDHLGPVCEPAAAKPAPLPKDAKPISPYP